MGVLALNAVMAEHSSLLLLWEMVFRNSSLMAAPGILNNGSVVGWELAGTAGVCARCQSEELVIHGGYK